MPNHSRPSPPAQTDAGSPTYRAPIAPRGADETRPLWSVMIPSYNGAHYLRETLRSVLAQDPGQCQMQIEVVDNCSTRDDPEAVVSELGQGRVEFFRQQRNLGHTANFNTCLERARGQWVHLLHCDDCVRPGFYAKLGKVLTDHPRAGAAFCRYISMDAHSHWHTIAPLEQHEDGTLPGWLDKIAVGQRLQPPCMVVRREVYEAVGGFDSRLAYHDDWEMWVRIAAKYATAYVAEPLALYRVHAASVTARGIASGASGRDFRLAVDIIRGHVDPGAAQSVARAAGRNYAKACLRRGHRNVDTSAYHVVPAQIRQALLTDASLGIIASSSYLSLRWLHRRLFGQAKPEGTTD